MLPGWIIFVSAFAYVLLLFAVASYGDRRSRVFGVPKNGRPIVYALSLAIYCTSWTYFGGVGLASQRGWNLPASISDRSSPLRSVCRSSGASSSLPRPRN